MAEPLDLRRIWKEENLEALDFPSVVESEVDDDEP